MVTAGTNRLKILMVLFFATSMPVVAQHDSMHPESGKTVTQGPPGRSLLGRAFDVGPRQKPWVIEGIGQSSFPITTANPEAQKWFDQGNTLLHSYWSYEAERAFRWTLKLDPECAMCYWGMARVSGGLRRAIFVREAAKRKGKVTTRERMYIEAWEQRWAQDDELSDEARQTRFEHALQEICMKYPEDLEAKLLFANERLGSKDPYGIDAILQGVLAVAPRHPGALHYRIHLWDRKEPRYILANSALYGSIATSAAHGQHMVGHIYSGVGMWHEAAINMEISDRNDLRYMRDHMRLPFHDWNYAHNRDYLSFVQEQLGMYQAALAGARELLGAPMDPTYNNITKDSSALHWLGMEALVRVLIKFERWNEILEPGYIPWGTTLRDEMNKNYCETLAWIGLGDLDKARKGMSAHAEIKQQIDKPENKELAETYVIQGAELQARFALAKDNSLEGLALLTDVAKRDLEFRRTTEALHRGSVLYNVLGEAYLARHSPELAVLAFEKALEVVKNDGFALSGLVDAYASMGRLPEARNALGRLLFVWSDADPGLKWLERTKHWRLDAQPIDSSSATQRRYKSVALEKFGPSAWEPYPAPHLDAIDSNGQKVTLDDFQGKNVLLVFYPPGECSQCVGQLVELSKKKSEFLRLDTEVVVVGGGTPQQATALAKANDAHLQMLWDPKFEDARRFHAYDDFEDIPLNCIAMIDKHSRVHWSREGGDPFADFDFLLKEAQRMNEGIAKARANQ